MAPPRDESPWRSAREAPPTEADPHETGREWVTTAHAAGVVGRPESWVAEHCRAGSLESTERAGEGLLVPLADVQELAARE